jgi:hypothetical protein
MNKRFWLAGVVTTAGAFAFAMLIHGVLLASDYAANAAAYRPLAEQYSHAGVLAIAYTLYGFGLTWIYQRGMSAEAPVGQGIRYGIAVALTFSFPNYLIYYAVLPLHGSLVVKQIVYETFAVIILGVVVALVSSKRGDKQPTIDRGWLH